MKILEVTAIAQNATDTCGIASIVTVCKYFKKNVTEGAVKENFGYNLLTALQYYLPNIDYADCGNFEDLPDPWDLIEKNLDGGYPVIIGLNGIFSASKQGHIVVIAGVDAEKVYYADPATGTIQTTTKSNIASCPPHPDGKFIFAVPLKYLPTTINPYPVQDDNPAFRFFLHSGKLGVICSKSGFAAKGKKYMITGKEFELMLSLVKE